MKELTILRMVCDIIFFDASEKDVADAREILEKFNLLGGVVLFRPFLDVVQVA